MLKIEPMDRSPKLDIFVKMTLRSCGLGDVIDGDELAKCRNHDTIPLAINI